MRKREMQKRIEELEFQLEMSERAVKINRNAANDYRAIADTYKSRENTFNKALELMKLRENLTFEQAVQAIQTLELPPLTSEKGVTN